MVSLASFLSNFVLILFLVFGLTSFRPPPPALATPEGIGSRTKFFLYNHKLNYLAPSIIGRQINFNDPSTLSDLSPDIPIKFLVHGFRQNYTCKFPQQLKDAYLSQANIKMNVVTVDWSSISQPSGYFRLTYVTTLLKIGKVSHDLAKLILTLKHQNLIDLSKTHVLGFSLGAQIAGLSGQLVLEKCSEKIGRITGLDPAGPGFDISYPFLSDVRSLSKNDATFVDIVHSDMATNGIRNYMGLDYGTKLSLGHVNFYLNGGWAPQPGCEDVDEVTDCSHYAATNVYLQSIISENILAFRCHHYDNMEGTDTCQSFDWRDAVIFGEYAKSKTRGHYYLKRIQVPWDPKHGC